MRPFRIIALCLVATALCGSEFILVRHCEPDDSYNFLSVNGKADARKVGGLLVGYNVSGIISSSKNRTKESAELIKEVVKYAGDIVWDNKFDQDVGGEKEWIALLKSQTFLSDRKIIVTHYPLIRAFLDDIKYQDMAIGFGTVIKVTLINGQYTAEQIKP